MKSRPEQGTREQGTGNRTATPPPTNRVPEHLNTEHRPFPKRWLLLGLLFGLFLLYHNTLPLYTDWLWFQEVGYTNVFTTTVIAKTLLFVVSGGLFFALVFGNIVAARRLAPEYADRMLMERFGPEWGRAIQKSLGWILFGVTAFVSLWVGRIMSENWSRWLEFTHGAAFHISDPVFNNDIGFYVFRLPFLAAVYSFLMGALLLTFIAVMAIHVADRAVESFAGLPDLRPGVRAQLLILLACIALAQAFGTRLNAYGLLLNDNGIYTGAGYVDVHQRLFALNAQIIALVFAAAACLASIRGRSFKAVIASAVMWAFSLIVLGGIWPSVVQRTSVVPNQFNYEREYIARNILYTRQGFGLANVQRVDNFPADQSLTGAQIQANRDTLDNVRLWDHPYLGKVYSQIQTIKQYYKFETIAEGGSRAPNIDIDRYVINGRTRQVMLAARELDSGALPESAQTWQNQKLAYTHGYGLVMSPVNKTLQGDPDYFIDGFPPKAGAEAPNLTVSQPEIYYGQIAHEQVYVDTQQPEFDYPSSQGTGNRGQGTDQSPATTQDHYATYKGKGGIEIGVSYLRRLAFASKLNDWNLMLASNLTPRTRILYRRDIRDRLRTVAPFVQQDGDAYLVLNPDNGKLVWVIDCYTVSDRYPYSTPNIMPVTTTQFTATNYMRNSIKATIDAYDGTINLYVSDPNDPIAKTYGRIFPGLLKPIATLPPGLRAHLRYPEDLFRVQRSVYATYHVEDPHAFYSNEDVWAVPTEPNPAEPTTPVRANAPSPELAQMEPYYVIMRLPDVGSREQTNQPPITNHQPPEFVLMSPLSPIKKEDQNILGWMCARCDGDNYGQLVLYRFPQQVSVEGPSQIVQRINSDKVISPQLALLRQGGSTASIGNMLVIPIEQSLLYIAPLYVESSTSANKLPKLQKVIVAFGNSVAMDDTLDKALATLFQGTGNREQGTEQVPTPPDTQRPTQNTLPSAVRALIDRAGQQYDTARQKLKQEDLGGYAEQMKALQQTLNELRRAAK